MAKKLIFPPANYYNRAVMEDTGCSVEDSHLVVQVMRDECGGTLDHLDKRAFKIYARGAKKALSLPSYRKIIESNFARR